MSCNEIAIRVDGLGKRYEIYDAPHDRLKQFVIPRLRQFSGLGGKDFFREYWALKSASFEVKKGESIGIVGRNGSGKSTLLQLIVGTLSPTTGSVETQGRIAALLELGSGFNPDYSGRENAYLNGALLGLGREEMDELMPEIAKFAGIGEFFDQPVKQYSSGMVVRVAFAVQAQVNPDILIVDEALAVGDAVFQHKCARRIHELRERGTTLLFVSHDPSAVATFCDRGLLLHQGDQVALGGAKEIVELYLARVKQELHVNAAGAAAEEVNEPIVSSFLDFIPGVLGSHPDGIDLRYIDARIGTGEGRIDHVNLFDQLGHLPLVHACTGDPFRLRVLLSAKNDISHPVLCYRIDTLRGIQLTGGTSSYDKFALPPMRRGDKMEIDIEVILPFKESPYSLALYLNNIPPGLPTLTLDGLETAAHINVVAGNNMPSNYLVETKRTWHVASLKPFNNDSPLE